MTHVFLGCMLSINSFDVVDILNTRVNRQPAGVIVVELPDSCSYRNSLLGNTKVCQNVTDLGSGGG